MANTVIQLKWSEITNTPPSLNVAEPAYSNSSNKLFIGLSDNSVIAIGGKYYTDIIDAASPLDSTDTLVLRDSQGSFNANVIYANSVIGNITGSADSLTTARDIGLDGDATGNVSFDGSQNVTLTVELTNTGVTAGDYGGQTQIPTFTVDEDGRITSAANVSISTELNISADTGSNVISLAADTLTFVGGDGITTSIDPTDNVKFDVDNTVIRTTGNQSITGDFTVTGNLNVTGNLVSINVDTLKVDDPLLHLAANNETSDAVDIGFVGHYSDDAGVTKRHSGLFRDASAADKRFILFENLVDVGLDDSAVTVNVADPTFALANLQVNIVGGTISGLSSPLAIADGGTGASSFTTGNIVTYNGTTLVSLANTGTAGTYANASHVPVITTDEYGRVSGVTNTAISIDAAAISSGTLPIGRGGTNQTTFTAGQMIIFDGTSQSSRANVTQTITGSLAVGNTITSLTFDDITGGITAYTSQEISIAASQISSGILGVSNGGTGADQFTVKGVIVSDSASATGALSALTSSTEGHVLQINSSGVPTFAYLQGGTF